MNKAVPIVIGAALVGGTVLLATRARAAGECFLAEAWQTHYATYLGPSQLIASAFGPEAWSVIYKVEKWYPDLGEWDEITGSPWNYTLQHGQYLRFIVQQDAEVCGFRQESPEASLIGVW